MKLKTAIVIGAGDRGMNAYAPYALDYPHELEIIGIAEPDEVRRRKFQAKFSLTRNQVFSDWQAVLDAKIKVDFVIICTMDRAHFQPTLAFLKNGFDVLLEKPMSPHFKECLEMHRVAEAHNQKLTICHVLRYTPFWTKIKSMVVAGDIGDIVSIQLNENVEIMHMSHSFVRGNWKNKEKSSPMILQKSCHDMDIISYLMDKQCERISSYGSLQYFNQNHKPEGAPERCLQGCPVADTCPFHAGRYYLGEGLPWARKFSEDDSRASIIRALNETDYGKCVFQSDNNVVDHQVVNMVFEGGPTASFSMCGFTKDQTRIVQIMGTKGEIRGKMDTSEISLFDFLSREESIIKLPKLENGHGGGDQGVIKSFLKALHGEAESLSSSGASLQSHAMAFAAEASRVEDGKSIELEAFYNQY